MFLASGAVHDDFFPSVLWASDLNDTNTLDVPSDAEIKLADLPILEKDGAPDGGDYGICERISG